MHAILLVEDDRALCAELEESLKKWDFPVSSCERFDNYREEVSG